VLLDRGVPPEQTLQLRRPLNRRNADGHELALVRRVALVDLGVGDAGAVERSSKRSQRSFAITVKRDSVCSGRKMCEEQR